MRHSDAMEMGTALQNLLEHRKQFRVARDEALLCLVKHLRERVLSEYSSDFGGAYYTEQR
jgi:hypothetical protein